MKLLKLETNQGDVVAVDLATNERTLLRNVAHIGGNSYRIKTKRALVVICITHNSTPLPEDAQVLAHTLVYLNSLTDL